MKTNYFISTALMIFLLIATGCEKENLNGEDSLNSYLLQTSPEKKALRHTKEYDAGVATAWFSLLTDISKNTPYYNPQSLRILTYSGLALYESVVPGMPSYNSIYTYATGNSIEIDKKKDYYWPACANAAIYRIALRMIADYPQKPDLTAVHELYNSLNTSFQNTVTSEQLEKANQFGQEVADLLYDWAKTDGTFNADGSMALCPPYTPLGGPGNWVPTPPMYFPAAGACQGSLRTFIPGIAEMVMPPAPPSYSTDPTSDFYKMNEQVDQLSLKDLTEAEIANNQLWRDIFVTNYNVPTHMFRLTTNLVGKENVNLEDASLLFAKQGMAMSDAIGAAFYAKFEYSLLRPVTYIQDVMGYTSWNGTYPAPQHPSYPSTATSATTASATIWEDYFGKNYSFTDSIQADLYGTSTYNSFDGLIQSVGRSRTLSGINYQLSVDAGIQLGAKVGEKINALPFKK